MNKQITLGTILLVLFIIPIYAIADLSSGTALPNPKLRSQSGQATTLHDLMKKVTVVHLWKGD